MYSTTVSPRLSDPSRSAPSIIATAMRSFIEPLELRYSSLTQSSAPFSGPLSRAWHRPWPRGTCSRDCPWDGSLRAETENFSGQVALVHCDPHYFKFDKPLNRSSGVGVLANFTRVETFGARNTHWVSAAIDPSNSNLFVFEPRIVAANAG